MSAVVLALLFASTRGSFEQTSATVTRLTTDIIELDSRPRRIRPGSHAAPEGAARQHRADDRFRSGVTDVASRKPDRPYSASESVLYGIRALVPRGPIQASLQARALQLGTDVSQTRLILFTQPADSISRPFMTALVLWLAFIFGSFSHVRSAQPHDRRGPVHLRPLGFHRDLPHSRAGPAVRRPDADPERRPAQRPAAAPSPG